MKQHLNTSKTIKVNTNKTPAIPWFVLAEVQNRANVLLHPGYGIRAMEYHRHEESKSHYHMAGMHKPTKTH